MITTESLINELQVFGLIRIKQVENDGVKVWISSIRIKDCVRYGASFSMRDSLVLLLSSCIENSEVQKQFKISKKTLNKETNQ